MRSGDCGRDVDAQVVAEDGYLRIEPFEPVSRRRELFAHGHDARDEPFDRLVDRPLGPWAAVLDVGPEAATERDRRTNAGLVDDGCAPPPVPSLLHLRESDRDWPPDASYLHPRYDCATPCSGPNVGSRDKEETRNVEATADERHDDVRRREGAEHHGLRSLAAQLLA